MKNLYLILTVLILSVQIAPSQISKKFSGNTDYVHAVAFSPGGKYIASGGYDEKVKIWDIESGDLVSTININNKIFKLYFEQDARKIIVGTEPLIGISAVLDSFIVIYDAFTGKKNELMDIKSKSPNFFIPGYGNKLITTAPEIYLDSCKYIVNYNIENYMEGKCYKLFLNTYNLSQDKYDGSVFIEKIGSWNFNYPVAFSDNGKYMAIYSKLKDEEIAKNSKNAGIEDSKDITSNDIRGNLYIFDIANKKMLKRTILIGGYLGQKNILLSNDGSRFYYTGKQYFNDVIKILDVKKDEEVRILSGHTREILCLAMHPSGNFIASGGRDNTIRIWDINSGKELKVFEEHSDNINYITFSPDGRYLASASNDKTVRVWDLSSISKEIDIFALKYNIEKGLVNYVNEAKDEELRKSGNSEIDKNALNEKYSQIYNKIYDKTLEEYNKKTGK